MPMQTMQEFVRAVLTEHERIGARAHKQAQREGRVRAELKAARMEIARLQAQAETVQAETAAVYERLQYVLTGKTATPDAAFTHDLFENWKERWERLVDRAREIREQVELELAH